MKRFRSYILPILWILSITFMTIPIKAIDIPKPNDTIYVQDFANVLSTETETYIIEQNDKLAQASGAQIVIATVTDTGGYEIEDYAYEMFNEYQIGSASQNNGVLLLLAINDDNYWVMVGNGLENIFTGGKLKNMLLDHLEDDFAMQDYDSGVYKFFTAMYQELIDIYQIDDNDNEQIFPPIDTGDPISEDRSIFTSIINTIIIIFAILLVLIIISAFIASANKRKRYTNTTSFNSYTNPTHRRPTILPFITHLPRTKSSIYTMHKMTKSNYTPPRPTTKKSTGIFGSKASRTISRFTGGSRSSGGSRSFGGGGSRGGGAGRK